MSDNKITFKLEGDPQEYRLLFDFNEVCDAEPVAGCNLMQALAGGNITAAQTRGLLYACLCAGHREDWKKEGHGNKTILLLSEAGALLSKDMPTVLRALVTLLRLNKESAEESSEGAAEPTEALQQKNGEEPPITDPTE